MRRETKLIFPVLFYVILTIGVAFGVGFQVFNKTAHKTQPKIIAGASAQGDGIMVYSTNANPITQYRSYSGVTNDFSPAYNTVVPGTQPVINVVKTSPLKQEAISAYQDTTGNLKVLCYDGINWTNEWTVVVAATGTPTTRRFDIAYETNTGDVTVAYSQNAAASNGLAYRTKAGSTSCGSANWAAAANFPTDTVATSGTVLWVKAAEDFRSAQNLSAWAWVDNATTQADMGGAIWSGTGFANFKSIETSMEHLTAVGDVDNFDLKYESSSGDFMVVWGNSAGAAGTNGYRYMTCDGGTSSCTWSGLTTLTGPADEVMAIDLSVDPASDKMAMAGIGYASYDMSAGYWDGSAWTGYANVDATCETTVAVGTKKVTTGWLTNGSYKKWYIAYDDATDTVITYGSAVDGGAITLTTYTSTPALNDVRSYLDNQANPFNNAEVIMTMNDNSRYITAFKLTMNSSGTLAWSNMASAATLGYNSTAVKKGFSFVYWRFIPTTISGSLYDAIGGSKISALATVACSISGETATVNNTVSGDFTIPFYRPLVANDIVSIYVYSGPVKASTVTKVSAAGSLTGINLYQNYTTIRHEGSITSITNTDLATSDNVNEVDLLFSADGSSNVTFTKGLYILASKTYVPGANINVAGSWNNAGTFTAGTGTVTLNSVVASTVATNTQDFYNLNIAAAVSAPISTPYLWVANRTDSDISKIDTTNGNNLGDRAFTTNARSVAVDNAGYVWASNNHPTVSQVSKINIATEVKTDYAIGAWIDMLSIDAAGYVWYSNATANTVTKVNPVNGSTTDYVTNAGPRGIAMDNSGFVWVNNTTYDLVSKYKASTGEKVADYLTDDWPQYVAVDNAGYVWVTNDTTQSVCKIRASDGAKMGSYVLGSGVTGLAVDDAGYVWVANRNDDNVSKVNPTDGTHIDITVGDEPVNVAVDAAGYVWVINDLSSNVTKIRASDGAVIGTYPTGVYPFVLGDLTGFALQKFVLGRSVTGSTGSYSLSSNLSVTNDFTVSSGTLTSGANNVTAKNVVQSGGTLIAPSAGSNFTVSGNWNHTAGTFTHNSGTVTFTGDTAITGDTTFNNLTHATTGKTITVAASSTQTVSGALSINGTDASHKITLVSSSPGTRWNITPNGTKSVSWITVSDSTSSAPIGATNSTEGTPSSTTNWLASTNITISGTVYTAESKATNIGANKTVGLSVNGGAKTTVESGTGGTFSFTNVSMTANYPITIFVDDETGVEANLITQALDSSTNITGLELYTAKIVLRSEAASAMTNTLLAIANNSADSNIHYTDSTGSISFDTAYEVWIDATKTYTPGAAVTLGDLDNNGTFSTGSYAISVAGSWDNTGGTFTAGTSTITFTSTTSGKTLAGTMSGGSAFYNLTFDGVGGGWTLGAVVTVSNNLAITNGTVDDSGYQITGNATGTMTTGAGGTLKLSGGAAQASSVVQHKSVYSGTLAITPTTAPTAGNLLIAIIDYSNSSPVNPTVSDSNGNTWSAVSKYSGTGQYVPSIAVAYAYNCKAGATTITWANINAGTNDVAVQVIEVSGIVSSSDPFDIRANVDGKLLASTTTPTISNFTTNYKSFILAIYSNELQPSTFTQGANYIITDANTSHIDAEEVRTEAPAGTQSASFTTNVSVTDWIISVLNFREAETSGTTFPTGFTTAHTTLNATSSIIYNSPTSQTISGTPAYGNLQLSTASGTPLKTLGAATTINGNLTIDSANTLDISNGGNYGISLAGNFVGSGSFMARAGTVTLGGTGSVTTNAQSFYNLTVDSSSGTSTLASDLTATNNLTVSSGTLTSGAYTVTTKNFAQGGGVFNAPTSADALNVSGNFAHASGTFTAPSSSTVNLNGAGASTQVVTGDTTFVNLTATATAARTINFASASTQTVTGTWTVTGATGQNITLGRDGGTGTDQWNINPTAWNVDYVSVSNSNNQASAPINPAHWSDVTNNTNWKFPFLSQWNTANTSTGSSTNKQITLPLLSTGTYDFTVYWGDTTSSAITAYNQAEVTHTYSTSGIYDLEIVGTIDGWAFDCLGDRLKIIQISQWGNLRLGNNNAYFCGTGNLDITATDVLNLTGTTTMDYAFSDSGIDTVPSMNSWDMSGITTMYRMFRNTPNFDQNIASWDVSNVTDTREMFKNAAVFNQNIGSWIVTDVTSMYAMFQEAALFNQNIGSWTPTSVTNMQYMFQSASAFNQNIGGWDVSGVTEMGSMFAYASNFNQDISNWDVSSVTNMQYMFNGVTLSTANYSNLLIDWNALVLQNNVIFSGGSSMYSAGAAATARAAIITDHNWTITDGGLDSSGALVNDSLTFSNPYSTNVAIADDTTSWQFQAKVTSAAGPTTFNYVEMRLANSTDNTQPYDSVKIRWTEATDTFSETADTQSAITLTSTSADSNATGNQWTLDFKIKINNNFLAKDTQYAIELYSIDDSAVSDTDNYANIFQVTPLSLSLDVDNASLSFGSLLPGSIVTGTTVATVTTNYPAGYTLGVSDGVASSGSALLHTDASTRIADYAGTIATPTTWTGTGLGISVFSATGKDTSKWGTGVSEVDSNNKYAGAPQNAATIHSKTGVPTANDSTSIGYKLVVPNNQKTGDYSGDVTYTATGALP